MSRVASVWSLLLLLLCVTRLGFAEPRALSLEEAIRLAHEANPELRSYSEEVAAAKARVAGASTVIRDNPTVTATAGPRSSPLGRSLDFDVQVLQPIEIGGQRGARIDATRAGLAADQAQLDAIRNQVTANVRGQFAKALAARQRLQIADDALVIARQGAVAAEERLRAGAAPVLEVNSARVEIGRASRERAVAEGALTLALANLRLLIALDPTVELSLQGDLTPSNAVVTEPVSALLEEAMANRAEVRQNRRAVEAAQAEARLASRERIPTPRFGISYARENESGTTIIQGILAFELPLFNRNVAARGVTAARVRQVRVAQDDAERRVKQQTLTAIARVRAAEASAKGFGADVVKAMTDNMDLVTESYRAGNIDFLQLIVIRRQAVDARRDYIDVLEELSSARAELDLALGRSSPTR